GLYTGPTTPPSSSSGTQAPSRLTSSTATTRPAPIRPLTSLPNSVGATCSPALRSIPTAPLTYSVPIRRTQTSCWSCVPTAAAQNAAASPSVPSTTHRPWSTSPWTTTTAHTS